MENKLKVSSNPHVRDNSTTAGIMLTVVIALLPASLFGVYNSYKLYGLNNPGSSTDALLFAGHTLLLLVLCVVTCVLTEYHYEKLLKKKITVGDFSACVTGLLLGLNLPASAPWWIAVVGSVFAILVVKMVFGGLGQNFMNPALGARCFLLISFTSRMTRFAYSFDVDSVSSATPLALLKSGEAVNTHNMVTGFIPGTIGETSVIAIVIGAVILIMTGVIDLKIPASYIISFVVFLILFGGHGANPYYLVAHVAGGGLMLGAFFMATDYVTCPITSSGRIIFGILLGILTGVFRVFGASAEGVSYAIIIGNLLVPLIERFTIPKHFGYKKPEKGGE